MKFLSPAKLNLNLRVISKRIDGYHNLETTFQLIDLFDEITFEKSNESFNVSCDGLEIEPENNLIFKSFNAIKEYCEADRGIQIQLGANLGLSQTAYNFQGAYRSPIDQEIVGISISMPIFDWGMVWSRFSLRIRRRAM